MKFIVLCRTPHLPNKFVIYEHNIAHWRKKNRVLLFPNIHTSSFISQDSKTHPLFLRHQQPRSRIPNKLEQITATMRPTRPKRCHRRTLRLLNSGSDRNQRHATSGSECDLQAPDVPCRLWTSAKPNQLQKTRWHSTNWEYLVIPIFCGAATRGPTMTNSFPVPSWI